MIATFARLKWRLIVNGYRRRMTSPRAVIGIVISFIGAIGGATAGTALFASMRWVSPEHRHLIAVLLPSLIVLGWWFAPLLFGGVDETVDPARLVLLPLTRQDIRRGQIVAGLVGLAPTAVCITMVGLVIGGVHRIAAIPLVVLTAVMLPLAGLVGSRMLSTSLARMSRSRRGGDVAGLIAAIGGAAVFALFQLLRFLSESQLRTLASVLRWTPPGMVGDGIDLAWQGHLLAAAWRLAVLAALIVAAAGWWTHQLDRLLADPSRIGGTVTVEDSSGLAIFGGRRRFLPHTPVGAAVAKELVYLVRSPGRRAAILAGSTMGLVYVVVTAAGFHAGDTALVLASPLAMVFSFQYASNQFGVDPGAFWLEVVSGAPPRARLAGRQVLAAVTISMPLVVAAVATAIWSGGWIEFVAVLVASFVAVPAVVGLGSVVSATLVIPIPDSGNPFAARQSGQGVGCSAALVGFVFLFATAALVVPAELTLRWALRGPIGWAPVILALEVVVDGTVWFLTTRSAARSMQRRELTVLAELDARLNR